MMGDSTKKMSEEWRNMDPKKKKKYEDLQAKEKERYENEIEQAGGRKKKPADNDGPKKPMGSYFLF